MTHQERRSADTGAQERMAREYMLQFHCAPGVPCFTQCCRDVTIVLTPYDVVRLKNALGITAAEFLDRHAVIVSRKDRLIPMVVLKMEGEDKGCPFVSAQGCSVYHDRPWPCRMYPLDMNDDGTFRVIADASKCRGLHEDKEQSIDAWLGDQGVIPYEEMNELFSTVTIPLQAQGLDIDNPAIPKMVFMALYNIDRFRDFVFESSFLNRFDVQKNIIDKIKKDDTELLKLSFNWIKFGLFGEKLFAVKEQPRP